MKMIVVAQLMTVVPGLKFVGAVHSRQGRHLRLGLGRLQPAMELWKLLLRARYSLVLKLRRTPDGELASVVNGL